MYRIRIHIGRRYTGKKHPDGEITHRLAVDMDRGQRGRNDTGFRRIIEAEDHDVFRDAFAQAAKGRDQICCDKIIRADKNIRQRRHFVQPLLQIQYQCLIIFKIRSV